MTIADTLAHAPSEPGAPQQEALWAPPEAPIDMPRQVLQPVTGGWSLRRLWPVRDVNA
ncbi:hypothetical protein [Pseudoroseicyclus tamaricis]|uniref:Uncharacterized protein n=1 Tax=Pseudoroseicyclus tamaricis TaxID=2705421 RepID=A0A6B2K3N1_9RHOB|nr:hypothetical protein [Pseudoroseicyclus tamaricis]NDV01206.1 hypothetical protein [Pseudoroseicyclus tamaricis]